MATIAAMSDTFTQLDLSRMFGVTRPTIRRWWASGLLPSPFKSPAGEFRWAKSDIENWIAAHRATPEAEKENADATA